MAIDILGIVISFYLLSVLFMAMAFGFKKFRKYSNLFLIQAFVLFLIFLGSKNAPAVPVDIIVLIDAIELTLLVAIATLFVLSVVIEYRRGKESIHTSFALVSLAITFFFVLIELSSLLSTVSPSPMMEDIVPASYLIFALLLFVGAFLRAKRFKIM